MGKGVGSGVGGRRVDVVFFFLDRKEARLNATARLFAFFWSLIVF